MAVWSRSQDVSRQDKDPSQGYCEGYREEEVDKAAAADATEGEEESKNAEPREPKYILGLNCVRHNSSLVLVGTTDGRWPSMEGGLDGKHSVIIRNLGWFYIWFNIGFIIGINIWFNIRFDIGVQ